MKNPNQLHIAKILSKTLFMRYIECHIDTHELPYYHGECHTVFLFKVNQAFLDNLMQLSSLLACLKDQFIQATEETLIHLEKVYPERCPSTTLDFDTNPDYLYISYNNGILYIDTVLFD